MMTRKLFALALAVSLPLPAAAALPAARPPLPAPAFALPPAELPVRVALRLPEEDTLGHKLIRLRIHQAMAVLMGPEARPERRNIADRSFLIWQAQAWRPVPAPRLAQLLESLRSDFGKNLRIDIGAPTARGAEEERTERRRRRAAVDNLPGALSTDAGGRVFDNAAAVAPRGEGAADPCGGDAACIAARAQAAPRAQTPSLTVHDTPAPLAQSAPPSAGWMQRLNGYWQQTKDRVFATTERWAGTIAKWARGFGVSEALVHAVVQTESNGNPNACSGVGACGLMQLMPDTARGLGVRNRKDPEQNIRGGVKYLKELLDRFDGNIVLAAAGYNAGPNRAVLRRGMVPTFEETTRYVVRITERLRRLGGPDIDPTPYLSERSRRWAADELRRLRARPDRVVAAGGAPLSAPTAPSRVAAQTAIYTPV